MTSPEKRGKAWFCALLTALIVLSMPGVLQWSVTLYVENSFTFYLLLAVGAAGRGISASHRENGQWRRWAVLAGVFAGLCAGTKYTGLLFAGVLSCSAFLLFAHGWRAKIWGAEVAGICCWLVFSPWLLKNVLTTGNPFYPLWNLSLGVNGWDAVLEKRFYLAHRPGWGMADTSWEAVYSAGEFLRQVLRVFLGLGNASFGALALAGVGGWLIRTRRVKLRSALMILAWLAGLFLIWFFFTHRIERFFHSGLFLMAILAGAGLWRILARGRGRFRLGAAGVLLGIPVLMLGAMLGNFSETVVNGVRIGDVLSGTVAGEDFLRAGYRYQMLREMPEVENNAPRTLLVGPADVFYLPRNYTWASVFNQHPFFQCVEKSSNARELAKRLNGRGYSRVYFHWAEWWRLQSSYYRAYALSPEKQRLIRDFLDNQVRLLAESPCGGNEWCRRFAERNPGIFRRAEEVPTASLVEIIVPAGNANRLQLAELTR